MNEKPVKYCGQQQQWEAVPPYQLLESAQTATSQDPRACSGLPGLELGAAKQIQSSTQYQLRSINQFPQLK